MRAAPRAVEPRVALAGAYLQQGARDRRPAASTRAPTGCCARRSRAARRPRRARRERGARALQARLPRRPRARTARACGAARRARAVSRARRRARRARPLRRGGAHAAADDRRQADARRLRARLLPARAARRPRRRGRRDAPTRSPPAVRRARAWPRCRRCWAGSSSRAAGRPPRARRTARRWPPFPGYPGAPRRASRGWTPRAATCAGAIRRWRALAARLPLPEYVIGLGEAELAAGRPAPAGRDLALIRAERRLLRRRAASTPTPSWRSSRPTTATPRRAVALARRAWRAAPGLRAADALGWALTRGGRPAAGLRWARRALALGSRDPLFRHHAGMAALAAGPRARGAPRTCARRSRTGSRAGRGRPRQAPTGAARRGRR